MNISDLLNEYLNNLGDINKFFNSNSNEIIKQTLNLSLKFISIDITTMNSKLSNNIIKLMNERFKKLEKKESLKNDVWYIKYNELIKKLNYCSIKLNKLMKKIK